MPEIQRRTLLRSLLTTPVAAAALPVPALPNEPAESKPAINETPDTPAIQGSGACDTIPATFSSAQFAALRKLAGIVVPSVDDAPGAVEAGVPEFLDFLIGASPADRVELYKNGLDRLNAEAERRYKKAFSELSAEEAAPILGPLRDAWSYKGPADPFARFLQTAKNDLLQGTVNSEDYILVVSQRKRSAGGIGTYWRHIGD
jgi:hypothetical protein